MKMRGNIVLITRQSPTDHLVTLLVAKALGVGAESRVLDLGCGSGQAGLDIAQRFGCSVDFVDNSSSRIGEVEHSIRKLPLEVRAQAHHACANEYLENCALRYDLVLAHGGLLSLLGPSLASEISSKCLAENGAVHFSMLSLRRVPFKEVGGCDVPQIVPEEVIQQYRHTVLSTELRWLPFEDEAVEVLERKIGNCWVSRSSGLEWGDYYKSMYSAAKNGSGLAEDNAFARSTAIDEAYYKMIGQQYLDYSSFVASRSPLIDLF